MLKKEKHLHEFWNLLIPVELYDLMKAGKCKPSAVMLASIINSLSKKDGRGCFATNEYLAREMGTSVSAIKRHLVDIEKLGYLKSVWYGKQREMWIMVDGTSLSKRRKRYLSVNRKPSKRDMTTATHQKTRQFKNELSNSSKMNCLDDRYHYMYLDNINSPSARGRGSASLSSPRNGHLNLSGETEERKVAKEQSRRFLAYVHAYQTKNGHKLTDSRKSWLHFEKLGKETPKESIDKVIDWYSEHIGEEHIPEVGCGESFRRKFNQLVSAMKRTGDALPVTDPDDLIWHVDRNGKRFRAVDLKPGESRDCPVKGKKNRYYSVFAPIPEE